jgi:hypothetical protein
MKALNASTNRHGGFMKKTFMFLSFAVILAVTASLATAGSAIVLRGEVPFDFYVENQMLPAGEYHFEMGRTGEATASSITVRAKDGTVVAFVTTRPGVREDMAPSQLSFNGYEGKYFLSSVECPGYKANLRKTRVPHRLEVPQIASISLR